MSEIRWTLDISEVWDCYYDGTITLLEMVEWVADKLREAPHHIDGAGEQIDKLNILAGDLSYYKTAWSGLYRWADRELVWIKTS